MSKKKRSAPDCESSNDATARASTSGIAAISRAKVSERASERASSSSVTDIAQLATHVRGIQCMTGNLMKWLHTAIAGGTERDADGGGLSADQASEVLGRISTMHAYSTAHVEMAQRASKRVVDAKQALREAEIEGRKFTKLSNAAKMPAARHAPGVENKKKKAKKSSTYRASTSAKASSSVRPQKAKPTKLEKDISKEIKILPSRMSDYTTKCALWRLEKILVDSGKEGLASFRAQGGLDAIFRFSYTGSNDRKRAFVSFAHIISILETSDILEKRLYPPSLRLRLMLVDIRNLWSHTHRGLTAEETAFGYTKDERPSLVLLEKIEKCALADPETFGKALDSNGISAICAIAFQNTYYQDIERHAAVTKFCRIVAETSKEGLEKLRAMRQEVLRTMNDHGRKRLLYGDCYEGHDCDDSCHSDAEKVKALLGDLD